MLFRNTKKNFIEKFCKEKILKSLLLEHIPCGLGIFEIINGVVHQKYINDGYYQMIGEDRKNRILSDDTTFFTHVHPDDVVYLKVIIRNIIDGQVTAAVNYRIIKSNGNYIWIRLDLKAVHTKKNGIIIYCCFTNITEYILAKDALKNTNNIIRAQYEQELSRRKILERGSYANFCVNVSKNEVTCNSNLERFRNLPKNISTEKALEIMLQKIPIEKDRIAVSNFMQIKHAKNVYAGGEKEASIDYRSYQDDGRLHWIRVTCSITENSFNKNLLVYLYFYDIDLQKKKALATHSVVSRGLDFTVLYDVPTDKATFIYVNTPDLEYTLSQSFTLAEVVFADMKSDYIKQDKAKVIDFFSPDSLVEKLSRTDLATITYSKQNEKKQIYRKLGKIFYLDETYDTMIITQRDITSLYEEEQKQKKKLQIAVKKATEANIAKSDFLALMSHDMRTPMNGILGSVNLALNEINNPVAIKEYLNDIVDSGNFLLQLINDVLETSKIQNMTFKLNPEPYSYQDFIASMKRMICPLCEQKSIKLELNEQKDNPIIVVDKVRFQQIFFNVFTNAVKYTPQGGEIVHFTEIEPIDENHIKCKCHIKDNGIGMSEEFQKRMFEAFTQENPTDYNPRENGVGLGLYTANRLIQLMGGKLEIKSKKGEGTEVIIHSNLEIVNVNKTKEKPRPLPKLFPSLKNKNILLAEDHHLNAKISIKLLEKVGCKIDWQQDGQKALESFSNSKTNEYDIILMDIRMPVMNGLEATKKIRALDRKDAKTIPIIAITANAYKEDVEASLKAGMNAHLTKPFEPQKMYQTIEQALKHD